MIQKNFGAIDKADIDSLIANGVNELKTLAGVRPTVSAVPLAP